MLYEVITDLLRGSRRLKLYISSDKIEIDDTNLVMGIISGLIPNKKIEERIEGIVISEDEIARITSYNVCYTKLLRSLRS